MAMVVAGVGKRVFADNRGAEGVGGLPGGSISARQSMSE
jgi:hypothetical protein